MISIVNVNNAHTGDYEQAVFARYGASYSCADTRTEEELVAAAKDADVVLFTSAKFTERVFNQLPKLKLMVRYGMGYDTVDLEAARAHGVDVCNAPTYGAAAVAEHSIALLVAVNRKITSCDRNIREGHFGQSADYESYLMTGKTLGIVGFGRIARQVAAFGKGLGMRVMAYDPYLPDAVFEENGARRVNLDELYADADFISVNAPLTKETYHLVDAAAFAKMKPEAVLVNTSRGALIDETALVEALLAKKIRAAGIDVYENYPTDPASPLLQPENLILTPHIAWNTVESFEALHQEVTEEVVRFLEGKPNLNVVNRA